MVGLMDAVANYDNAENAIGYSVYAYAADMYGNGNEIKFLINLGLAITKNGVPHNIDVNSVFRNKLTTTSYVIRHKMTRTQVILSQL